MVACTVARGGESIVEPLQGRVTRPTLRAWRRSMLRGRTGRRVAELARLRGIAMVISWIDAPWYCTAYFTALTRPVRVFYP